MEPQGSLTHLQDPTTGLSWTGLIQSKLLNPTSLTSKYTVYINTNAARSKAWTVFARSNAGIVGSNPTQGMDVCV
jgi:hypothetical protein